MKSARGMQVESSSVIHLHDLCFHLKCICFCRIFFVFQINVLFLELSIEHCYIILDSLVMLAVINSFLILSFRCRINSFIVQLSHLMGQNMFQVEHVENQVDHE